METLTCPKCQGAMRTYERNGVHVDQCAECRGIFLDRGELERLMDAENSWHEQERQAPAAPPPSQSSQPSQLGAIVSEVMQQAKGRQTHGYGQPTHGYPYRKKKKSFLGELFD